MRRVLVALASVAIVLAACSGAASRGHTAGPAASTTTPAVPFTTTTQSPVTSTTQPLPRALQVEDLTLVSDTHGWALVHNESCGKPACTAVLTTSDGGVAWRSIGSITAPSPDCTGCGTLDPARIRFANNLDGYAFDPDLFVSTDGGVTWSQRDGPNVAALESAGTDVMRIVYTHTGCPGPCDLTVQVAPAGSDTWETLTAPFQGDAVQLVRQGTEDVYIASFENPAGGADDAHASLMISHDGGVTWSDRADPCREVDGDEYDAAAIAGAPQSVLTVLCRDRMQFRNTFIAVSTEGGSEFTSRPLIPGPFEFDKLAATSSSSIFLAVSPAPGAGLTQYSLLSSSDGGHHWRQVATVTGETTGDAPASAFLGFESSSVGRWVVGSNDLWQTTDGGSQWVHGLIAP